MATTFMILRVIHIVAGAFWVGATLFLVYFVGRTASGAGPDGARFMDRMLGTTRFPTALAIAGGLSVFAGIILYGIDSAGFKPDWSMTPTGLTFGIGGLAAILAIPIGAATGRAGERMIGTAREIAAGGGPPSAQQSADLAAAQRRLDTTGSVTAVLLLVAITAMSIARYV